MKKVKLDHVLLSDFFKIEKYSVISNYKHIYN